MVAVCMVAVCMVAVCMVAVCMVAVCMVAVCGSKCGQKRRMWDHCIRLQGGLQIEDTLGSLFCPL